jgi:hypothetical protein
LIVGTGSVFRNEEASLNPADDAMRDQMKPPRVLAVSAIAVAILVSGVWSPASARPWRRTDRAAAQDYLLIEDQRAANDIVLIWWLAPPMLPEAAAVAGKILDQYFVLGVVHGHVAADGRMTFDATDAPPTAMGSDGQPMKLIAKADMSPGIVALTAGLQASLGQALGPMGNGIQWNTFSGQVRACSKGRASVSFAGETYTYDTPVPGCSAN